MWRTQQALQHLPSVIARCRLEPIALVQTSKAPVCCPLPPSAALSAKRLTDDCIVTATTQAEPTENGTLKKSLWGHSFITILKGQF